MPDAKKLHPPQWLGRPITSDEHVQDLETRAAINEFHHKMPRHEAEQHAHEGYVKEQRERAAAHHLAGMKAAMATGNHEDARKHWALYDLHLKGLGKDSIGAVPPEVEKRMMEDGGEKPVYKFKAHKGDLYALHEPTKDVAPAEGQAIQKTEARQCKWKLGERRCQRMVTASYCHDHVDHWANKIKQKERAQEVAKEEKKPGKKYPDWKGDCMSCGASGFSIPATAKDYNCPKCGSGETYDHEPEAKKAELADKAELKPAQPKEEKCRVCGKPSGGGEGWDGMCGTCADKAEAKKAELGHIQKPCPLCNEKQKNLSAHLESAHQFEMEGRRKNPDDPVVNELKGIKKAEQLETIETTTTLLKRLRDLLRKQFGSRLG